VIAAMAAHCAHAQSAAAQSVYQDPKAPLAARVDDLFSRLTPDERLSLLSGTGYTTQPIAHLGVPPMGMADAGQGVRGGPPGMDGPATLFPSEATMAFSWDREMVARVAKAIGEEVQNKGTGAQILLAPDVNIHRSPLGGRNGESFSEDPFLAAQLAIPYVVGMQSSGAAACVKHFACNNEEVDRNTVDVHVDERALREIYLPAFQAGVQEGHSWSVMAAYNKINGFYATANQTLDTDILKKQWGFDGILMSDWGAVHETVGAVNAGNDVEMPGGQFLTVDKLKAALSDGSITQAAIDDSVHRILRTIVRVGLLDGPHTPAPAAMVNSPEHQHLTYEAASEAIILLKNERHVLPLDRSRIKSIAVIGPAAANMQLGALGSPQVTPFYSIMPLDGIRKAAGDAVTVNYVEGLSLPKPFPDPVPASALSSTDASGQAQPGLHGEYFTSDSLQGTPAATRVDAQIPFGRNATPPVDGTVASIRWTGKLTAPTTGTYTLSLFTGAGCRIFINDKPIVDDETPGGRAHSGKVDLTAGQAVDLRIELVHVPARGRGARFGWATAPTDDIAGAVAAAAKSDVAIVFVTTFGQDGEGRDRPTMALPGAQDRLIQAVAAANPHTIVVLNTGTPVQMTGWLDQVPGLLDAGFPGQEGGRAIASVLFGDVDPSGKTVDTLAARREDYPDFGNFPGTRDAANTVNYAEGIYVGYRHFDREKITPLFPFGYGLSYTSFRYGNLKLSQSTLAPDGAISASVDVTNTGSRDGAEVVQLYIHDPHPTIDKPVRELKGFARITLKAGETGTMSFPLSPRSFAYFDVPGHQWKADAGSYDVEIGASSRDIRLTSHVKLTSTYTKGAE
jgi:beta-glucosidase